MPAAHPHAVMLRSHLFEDFVLIAIKMLIVLPGRADLMVGVCARPLFTGGPSTRSLTSTDAFTGR